MRTKLFAIVAIFAFLLGAAGCTPAAGDTANLSTPETSAMNTTASEPEQTTEQAAEEEPPFEEGLPPTTSYVPESPISQSPPPPTPIRPADLPADDQPSVPPADTPQQPVSYKVTHAYYFDGFSGEEWGGDPMADPPVPDNSGKPDDFITVAYNVADLEQSLQWGIYSIIQVGDSYVSMGAFHYAYPIQCLRKVDENHYYAVYKIQQGGYYYVHFQRMLKEPEWAVNDDVYHGSYYKGQFVMTGRSYLTQKRSSADYAGIAVGDLADGLVEIDGSAAFEKYRCETYKKPNGDPGYIEFWKYLTDGAMRFFCRCNEQGKAVVEEKEFYPGGIVDYEAKYKGSPFDWDGEYIVADLSILPQDFPD